MSVVPVPVMRTSMEERPERLCFDDPEGQMIVSRLKERYGFDDAAPPRDVTVA